MICKGSFCQRFTSRTTFRLVYGG